ncbi:MAG: DEAD/DEAH box helicase [Bacteroidia bacterium]|nr:DEAD/DEAH box helicase [Bacteroidia bacterium]
MQSNKFSIEQALDKLKINALNEMQLASLEANKKHQDIILLSATGSGKTLAFLLPVLQLLEVDNKETQALIIVPSRELAIQIEKVFKSIVSGFKVTCCYGGHKREIEENNLLEPPALLIGTPGRLADHIRRGNLSLTYIHTVVLDEFDKSLEMGFQDEMSFIIRSLPALNKRILTSATEAVEIPTFMGLNKPHRLDFLLGREDTNELLAVRSLYSDTIDKTEALFRLICFIGDQSTIIFCNHRETVEQVSEMLDKKGIRNEFYHGALEQKERDSALGKFRNGTSDVLVTTDLASRGLDIPNIRHIIHFQLPLTEDAYTHRNGRTARQEASGTITLILGPKEYLPAYIDSKIEQLKLPATFAIPDKPKWMTLFIAAGKKDKINKIDIVGFLSNKGQLKKEDIGLIEVKDYFSFVAVRKSKIANTLALIREEKIKNRKIKIEVAK